MLEEANFLPERADPAMHARYVRQDAVVVIV
jgi:hypothetical protein